MSSPTSGYVTPAQLCIGMYVRLDLPWTDHPFTFSSFKIKNFEQIVTLQALGLERVHYNPAKSDSEPLSVPRDVVSGALPATPTADNPFFQAKRARIERRLLSQQARVTACEREFVTSARVVKSINQNLFSKPEQARQEAEALHGWQPVTRRV